MYDQAAVKDLQWAGNDIAGAKKLLDDAGIKDTDDDGWRELKGKKLPTRLSARTAGRTGRRRSKIVAAAGKKIGIDITTKYPEWAVYQTVFTDAKVNDVMTSS